jgi:glycyl-tRNA synthetase
MSHTDQQPTLKDIVALAKRRGFVYQTSEIYGGLANSYDYGPLGAQLLKNIKDLWWNEFITSRPDMVGLDTSIMQHPETWVASGHVDSFTDPLVEDLETNLRYRADHLIEEWVEAHPDAVEENWSVEDLSTEEMAAFITEHEITSPDGNPVSDPKDFNILFETMIGAIAGEKSKVYLRGETAQGIFANFKQVLNSTRVQLPFGIGNFGRSFRNEITTGQFVFRTLEFEQAEIEYFFNPEQQDWQKLMQSWQDEMWAFVTQTLGVREENLRWRQHTDTERSHYSLDTYDLDYNFPFGYKELWGIAYRTDYDLRQHQEHSGESLEYRDPYTHETFIPHVIEPAVGIGRLFLMLLTDAYWEDEEHDRTVLRLDPKVAPNTVAVFPLLKNKPELIEKAQEVFELLRDDFVTTWDERGNVGKRYRYQDEIGTPFCVTVDFDSLDDEAVTVRDRDTTEQVRIPIAELPAYLEEQLQ